MMETAYQPPEGFLTMAQAQERLGISKATLQRLVKNDGITVYRDPRNKRVRLLKADDLARLRQPVPEA
jgi:excisionase family DNA binding protein